MRRDDRAQDRDFSLALIDRCTHGVMALSTGEPLPYCLPLSFVRIGEDLFFHCAREGRKVDLLRRSPQVCVTFVGDDRPISSPSSSPGPPLKWGIPAKSLPLSGPCVKR